ncbi:MAG: hypothetical protein JOZ27_06215 [Caulobacteraceae bacterium]|nr:hypothetical protein [Caulobacteraceae bacterium]
MSTLTLLPFLASLLAQGTPPPAHPDGPIETDAVAIAHPSPSGPARRADGAGNEAPDAFRWAGPDAPPAPQDPESPRPSREGARVATDLA